MGDALGPVSAGSGGETAGSGCKIEVGMARMAVGVGWDDDVCG